MRNILVFFCAMLLIIAMAAPAGALTVTDGMISDDFNDGDADGWWLGHNPRGDYGNWFVENGTLVQDKTGDHYPALVENFVISDQSIETQVLTSLGYGGVTLWYQDVSKFISVYINPHSTGIMVTEVFDDNWSDLRYPHGTSGRLYDLKVDADSATGELAIYLDDIYIFTYYASTPYRSGLSGVSSGNGVGYFDNFRLTSDDINPEPAINAILAFFDESVANSTLEGEGPGNSANGRLNVLRNMLEMAGDLIAIGDIEGACDQLKAAISKCDGDSPPPDFVTGSAVSALYTMILELMAELGC